MTFQRDKRIFCLGSRMLLSPGDGDGGGGGAENSGNTNAKPGGQQGDPPEFKAITTEAELATYKADLRKNIANEVRTTLEAEFKQKQTDQAAAEQRTRDEADAKAKGDFDKVETALRTDIASLTEERDRLKADNARMAEAIATGLEEQWKSLPEHVRKLAEKAHPDTDVIGRYEYLQDPDVKNLVDALGKEGEAKPPRHRNDDPPRKNGDTKISIEDTVNDFRKLHGVHRR